MPASSKTILVVDDYEAQLSAAKRTLESAGFLVITAANGVEALFAARRNPDLILLDVGLPDLNGFNVCRILKRDPTTTRIPVVFMSATHTDTSSLDLGAAAGSDAFLFHPATRQELLSVIAGAMARASARAARP